MSLPASWLREVRRLGLMALAGGAVGWLFGRPFLGVALVMIGQTIYWLYQLLRIQRWLEQPQESPPEGVGVWGEVYDQIYHLQRRNRESYARLQSTVDYLQDSFSAMRDAAVMVGEGGSIEWSNDSARRLLGLQYPRDRGQALLNLVRLPEFHRYFLAADFSEPLRLNVGGESQQVLQFEVTPFGAGNRLLFVRDITKMARLEQMRRDFVGNVSHELRTPLTVIKGYLDTILAHADQMEPRFLRPLQQMEQQTGRMETLLKDLLWLSRIESEDRSDRQEVVDVATLLSELQEELRSSHPERRLELELDTSASVVGDYTELYSAISNLVLNAFKYSDDDTTVRVRWQKLGDDCLLSVQDQGIGIAESHIPRITERFYRVDDSRSTRTGGTGLGLAIVKHVAAAHRAELSIDSAPGRGSTFSLRFPALEPALSRAQNQ